MTRVAWGIWFFCIVGCAGKLSNKQAFLEAGPPEDAADNNCALENVQADLIDPRCSTAGCHNAAAHGTAAGGGLALVNEAVDGMALRERLVDVESDDCAGKKFVDTANLAQSYLLEKLSPEPACGTMMPQIPPPLTEDEMACVQAWIQTLVDSQ
ncbi:MAG: hypothetical protein H6714_09965 [Myxococcales bacterium]|nr:hypothetical protein [Myxococcales bacterium]